MSEAYKKFISDSRTKAFDTHHRDKIKFNISRYDTAVIKGKQQYTNLEMAKTRAGHIKNKVVNDLPKYLVDFEAAFQARGGKVIWAQDAHEALQEVLKIAKSAGAQLVVKSKSMVSEEIGLNESLHKAGIESVETDLGEYIVQIAGEKPYHIVTPAMHKSKEEVAALFHEKFQLDAQSTPEQITAFVRGHLRQKFYNAGIGITGANFLVADTGAVCVTENEGNGVLGMSFPHIHIVIAGIEKLIPRLRDLDLFWPLLATYGTGQHLTVYNSIVFGPKRENEPNGPEEMYVILLDNGRTELLARKQQRRALSCIRCGACLNTCPIYKNIGGHAYGVTYSGPIGAVVSPWMKGMKEYHHLSFASSLCGACTEVCPVRINLHELLLYNRNDSVKEGYAHRSEKIVMMAFRRVMGNRKYLNMLSSNNKNKLLRKFFAEPWGKEYRNLPTVAPATFNEMWAAKHKGNN